MNCSKKWIVRRLVPTVAVLLILMSLYQARSKKNRSPRYLSCMHGIVNNRHIIQLRCWYKTILVLYRTIKLTLAVSDPHIHVDV